MPNDASRPANPQFSVIIPVFNDWGQVEDCLRSLNLQTGDPEFEVIIVDDGSAQKAPESIREWKGLHSLTLIEQSHAGIASARNRGLESARGAVFVFTDADCRLQANCLSVLGAAIANAKHDYFQLHLTGDCSNLVGQAEELRLMAIQDRTLQMDGYIRYLNTAGFAVRRTRVDIQVGLFDPVALRSEDTLLLVDLIRREEPPLFVADAVVQHAISMSVIECLKKDFRSAWLDAKTFAMIEASGVQVRMSHRDRIRMLFTTWNMADEHAISRKAWCVLMARQSLQRMVTFSYRCLRPFLQSKVL
jgi:glycosyltransferase involved in cell wall biosynthesis